MLRAFSSGVIAVKLDIDFISAILAGYIIDNIGSSILCLVRDLKAIRIYTRPIVSRLLELIDTAALGSRGI
jgi:hypothetical protein